MSARSPILLHRCPCFAMAHSRRRSLVLLPPLPQVVKMIHGLPTDELKRMGAAHNRMVRRAVARVDTSPPWGVAKSSASVRPRSPSESRPQSGGQQTLAGHSPSETVAARSVSVRLRAPSPSVDDRNVSPQADVVWTRLTDEERGVVWRYCRLLASLPASERGALLLQASTMAEETLLLDRFAVSAPAADTR